MNDIQKKSQIIFLMGPTASGKSDLAITISQLLPIEIISVDSGLIYRKMNIGTSKPSITELKLIPHRLLDIKNPSETYSVAEFQNDALIAIEEIIKNGKIPFLVGGTMLYFKTLLTGLSPLPSSDINIRKQIHEIALNKGWDALHCQLSVIDPISANRIHVNDTQRITRALEVFLLSGKTLTEHIKIPGKSLPYDVYQFALIPSNRNILYERIELRFKKMLDLGFENESKNLFATGELNIDMPAMRCLGYPQMWSYMHGQITYNEMIDKIIHATKQFAKHQITWLQNWKNVYWLNSDHPKLAIDYILKIITNKIYK
ncbi:MAG: tRNA (adenosine(37)-N6)-dimethylallyltransferase MiaA [Pantoea sp. Brub]|nr:tRNA (adenosine(37)-N6)-dimethylallyltransferase MiaA [Pantoea sp. Brub]